MKKFLLILSILLLAFLTSGCQNQVTETSVTQTPLPKKNLTKWDIIVTNGEIRVGVPTLDDSFDNQLIDAFSKEANLTVTKVLIPKDTPMEQAINDGSVDMIWGQIPATSESSTMFRLSNPYFHSTVLYLSNKEDLTPDKQTPVGVLKNSAEAFIANCFFENVTYFQTEDDLFWSLANQSVDCILYNKSLFEKRSPSQKLYIVKESPCDLVVAFQQNNTSVAEEVEKILAKIKADGTASEICTRWYPEDLINK